MIPAITFPDAIFQQQPDFPMSLWNDASSGGGGNMSVTHPATKDIHIGAGAHLQYFAGRGSFPQSVEGTAFYLQSTCRPPHLTWTIPSFLPLAIMNPQQRHSKHIHPKSFPSQSLPPYRHLQLRAFQAAKPLPPRQIPPLAAAPPQIVAQPTTTTTTITTRQPISPGAAPIPLGHLGPQP